MQHFGIKITLSDSKGDSLSKVFLYSLSRAYPNGFIYPNSPWVQLSEGTAVDMSLALPFEKLTELSASYTNKKLLGPRGQHNYKGWPVKMATISCFFSTWAWHSFHWEVKPIFPLLESILFLWFVLAYRMQLYTQWYHSNGRKWRGTKEPLN